MRWLPFAMLALIAIVCQTTVAHTLAIRSIWPEWTFVLAVHYALWGAWPDAAIAAWVLGLVVDLQTAAPNPIGLHAFCYGAAAWVILRLRQLLFRDHPFTHLLVTLILGLGVQCAIAFYYSWRLTSTPANLWTTALGVAIYTAVWAPLLHWPLIRLGWFTGLRPSRRTALLG